MKTLCQKISEICPKKSYLIVWTHAGDAHSFIGNGGSSDSSLESKFIGIGNRHYLHVTPILNLFLHDIAFARSSLRPYPYREVLSEARMGKPSVSDSLLIPEEGFDKKKSNKNYIWWISGIGISALLFIFIYKKINPVRFIQ